MDHVQYKIVMRGDSPPGYDYYFKVMWRQEKQGWRKYYWTKWKPVKYWTYAGSSDETWKSKEGAQEWIDKARERKKEVEAWDEK